MLQHILPDLITKSFCRWVLGALSATMKIHLQMSIHYNGLIVSGRTAGRPDWDRGGWQPACMANKLTRDPCDNEWLQRRVSVCVRACVRRASWPTAASLAGPRQHGCRHHLVVILFFTTGGCRTHAKWGILSLECCLKLRPCRNVTAEQKH